MSFSTVYGLGEIVYDIFFKNNKVVHGNPGGSVLNALVNLAVMNYEVKMMSTVSVDELGKAILCFLEERKVGTEFIIRQNRKSNIALAFFNEENNAEYVFYKDGNNSPSNYRIPEFKKEDFFLYGSTLALQDENRNIIKNFIREAKNKETIIFYDPNIRKNGVEKVSDYRSIAEYYFVNSNIVRASADDLKFIYSNNFNPKYFFDHSDSLNALIVTDARNPVRVFVKDKDFTFKFNPVNAISTVGAGDAFNSALIAGLISKREMLFNDYSYWSSIIEDGIDLSSKICLSLNNTL